MRISGVRATIVRTLTVRIKDLPHDAFEQTRCGNRALGYRIEQKPGEIRATVFRENPHRLPTRSFVTTATVSRSVGSTSSVVISNLCARDRAM
jgi:hypothetical protein